MAEAQLHKGRAIVAYRADGEAIDSEGVVIEGAPKATKDTPPDQQPGALGAPTPEERMAIAIATAIQNPKALAAKGASLAGASAPAAPAQEAGYLTSAAHAPMAGSESFEASHGEAASGDAAPAKSASKRSARRKKA